ncbi:MAG: DUF4965 domain-containing protein [Planctomycetota bacterium]
MSWTVARLGSRFSLLFEPHRRRVMHSGVGRFLDAPLDLSVGLVDPDGVERVLPFTRRDDLDGVARLDNCEQFDRINSITFRGYSAAYRLRFELNVHAVFYPQNRRLCVMPAIYLEMRVHAIDGFRETSSIGPTPESVKLRLRIGRDETRLATTPGQIDLAYTNTLVPDHPQPRSDIELPEDFARVEVRERIVSLNAGATPLIAKDDSGQAGLELDLPVTEAASGVKWRLVWGCHVAESVLRVRREGRACPAKFAYTDYFPDLDAVLTEAVQRRDEYLALSRRFEKLIEQAPLDLAQQHLLNLSFQNYLGNTFWCTGLDESEVDPEDGPLRFPWFSVWEGSSLYQSTLDVEYNTAVFALTLWPDLLKLQLQQWPQYARPHESSNGAVLCHDLGSGVNATGQRSSYTMEVEENSNYLLMLQAYVRWTGDRSLFEPLLPVVRKLTRYLLWTDRDGSGFPTEGNTNTLVDGSAAIAFARKQTYLAIKRLAGLRAAADLFRLGGRADKARELDPRLEQDAQHIDETAWVGDHYAVACERSALEMLDPKTGKPVPFDELPGTDAYSIHTANGLLLPMMVGQPILMPHDRLAKDLIAADRENQSRYGDGHSSETPEAIRVSLNLWRDMIARYLGLTGPSSAQQYWDLQVMSNVGDNSLGFTDAYVSDFLTHYPRGIVTLGYFLATPRLTVNRLAPGGAYLTVEPDRHMPQRWPLLPLADWVAGRVPVCVVSSDGRVTIEAPTDPVIVHSDEDSEDTVSGIEFIG